MLGRVFNTVGTVVTAVDNTVTRTSGLVDKGFDAMDTLATGALDDLKADNIVEDARRRQRIAKANAEAKQLDKELEKMLNNTAE